MLSAVLAKTLLTRSDTDDVYRFVSTSALAMVGRAPGEMRGHRFDEFVPRADVERIAEVRALVRGVRTVQTVVHGHTTGSGGVVWLETAMWQVRQGRPGIWTSSTDVTGRVEAERRAASANHLLRLAIDCSPIGMAIVDSRSRWVDTNPVFLRMVGYSAEDLSRVGLHDMVGAEHRAAVRRLLRTAAGSGTGTATAEVPLARGDGAPVWVRLVATPLPAADDVRGPILLQAVDIGAERSREQDLVKQALHDPLTGAANRRLLVDRIDKANESRRTRGGTLAMVLLDLDGFKGINDRLGHRAGDEVLATVAERLRRAVREEDTVARLGGDEFAVLCSDVPTEEAFRLPGLVRAVLRDPIPTAGEDVPITASVGVALARDTDTADTLLDRADNSMYRDKRRNRPRRAH